MNIGAKIFSCFFGPNEMYELGQFYALPGTTPFVAMALIDIAVSIVCKRAYK